LLCEADVGAVEKGYHVHEQEERKQVTPRGLDSSRLHIANGCHSVCSRVSNLGEGHNHAGKWKVISLEVFG
jgi:hypothetical protein